METRQNSSTATRELLNQQFFNHRHLTREPKPLVARRLENKHLQESFVFSGALHGILCLTHDKHPYDLTEEKSVVSDKSL
jgi:hypothetical protein